MEIPEQLVSFEQAVLLKQKGFNVRVRAEWVHNTTEPLDDEFWVRHWDDAHDFNAYSDCISAPEHWQCIEWLRQVHGIWVRVNCDVCGKDWLVELKTCAQRTWDDEALRRKILLAYIELTTYSSPYAAQSAAFDHILKHII